MRSTVSELVVHIVHLWIGREYLGMPRIKYISLGLQTQFLSLLPPRKKATSELHWNTTYLEPLLITRARPCKHELTTWQTLGWLFFKNPHITASGQIEMEFRDPLGYFDSSTAIITGDSFIRVIDWRSYLLCKNWELNALFNQLIVCSAESGFWASGFDENSHDKRPKIDISPLGAVWGSDK